MDIARGILFGVVARHLGLIDAAKLIELLAFWRSHPTRSFPELLADRCGLSAHDRARINHLLDGIDCDRRSDGAVSPDPLPLVIAQLPHYIAPDELDLVRKAIISTLSASSAATAFFDLTTRQSSSPDAEVALVVNEPVSNEPRYTRRSVHASGGMGSVWLAHDTSIGRDVALKELRVETASSPTRFLREARITGQLEHPGIVPVYEIGRDPETGRPFYTMRFVRGRTLTEATLGLHDLRRAGRDEPLDFVNLLSAFVSVCHTIAYAHSRGVVHRDLKGENIILGDFGEVIVLDWGLAKRLDTATLEDEVIAASADGAIELGSAAQTVMGQVMGTPAYMAPEQARGQLNLLSPRTDIFGAGAILYEILAGRPPFVGETTIDVLKQARRGKIEPPSKWWPEVPPALEAICLKALAARPEDRFATATELAREVQGWQDKQRRQAEDQLRRAGERLMRQQAALVQLTRGESFAGGRLEDVFKRMSQVAAETLEVERVGVWRYTDDRRAIRCEMLYELSSGRTSSGVELRASDFPSYFQALEASEVLPAHDASQDPRTCEFTESYLIPLSIGAIMDAPIHVAGKMEGVVCHEHVGLARRWTPDEQLFAIAIANLVAQAIAMFDRR